MILGRTELELVK